ncbi:MAG: hypothetical protein HZB45_15320 [Mycolicibacterium rufum]|uniref:hypothetical protein n=1 Tax=Mycolicibacterium chlorophenolicum TaxID=37916 RepID=UPI00069DCEE5|nr:hypothetical protein [Mycolicibacterium chlorophenolicum]MBI5339049.1 hypothetical protein [Mycolicibacterium rufum]
MATYRGRQLPIAFSGDDWVALRASPGQDIPEGFEFGESSVGQGRREPWVKVPRSSLDEIVHRRVTGTIAGHQVTLRQRMPDGRIRVTFLGSPAVAQAIGLDGDQYMGWTGLFAPEDFDSIEVEETRRA